MFIDSCILSPKDSGLKQSMLKELTEYTRPTKAEYPRVCKKMFSVDLYRALKTCFCCLFICFAAKAPVIKFRDSS